MGNNSKELAGVLGRTVKIEGNLESSQVIRFDGTLDGTIIARNKLIMGQEGIVKGSIVGKELSIAGRVEGDIFALEFLEILPGANINGKVFGKRIGIHEGAVVNAFCKSGDFAAEELNKTSRKFSL